MSKHSESFRSILWVWAVMLACPSMGVAKADSGESWAISGQVEQIDLMPEGSQVWVRPMGESPVLVVLQDGTSTPVGSQIIVKGTRGDDQVREARDGRSRPYRLLYAEAPLEVVKAGVTRDWLSLLLMALVLMLVPFTILLSRRSGRKVYRSVELASDDWAPLEPTDLPEDPVEALAELARRADAVEP